MKTQLKYLVLAVIFFLLFYVFIIKNINILNEVKEDFENSSTRELRLKEEQAIIRDEIEKLSTQKMNQASNTNLAYFKDVGDLILFLDKMCKEHGGNMASIKSSKQFQNYASLDVDIEARENEMLALLRELEKNQYGLSLIDKEFKIEMKNANLLSLHMNLRSGLNFERTEKLSNLSSKDVKENLFAMETQSPSYMKIGDRIINARSSISNSEAYRRKERDEQDKATELEKKKLRRKIIVQKLKEEISDKEKGENK